jgi:hypothetical protein
MRTIRRVMVAGALAIPFTLGAAGIASADVGYGENESWAGPDGAYKSSVSSFAGSGGEGVYFQESSSWAGPDGAWTEDVATGTDGNGNTFYFMDASGAGPEGASSHEVSSIAVGDDADDEVDDEDEVEAEDD